MKDGEDRSFPGGCLLMLSKLYGCGVSLRSSLYEKGFLRAKELPCTVISIGNLTSGGTGKTPMAIKTAALVNGMGYKTAVVSRGYKGGAEKNGGIVSDGKQVLMEHEMAGDEPLMIAEKLNGVPVAVGAVRYDTGMLAVNRFSSEVIILDDGFQHIKLKRDINIVLLDCERPFGSGFLLPRGTLREPAAAVSRADAVILTRTDSVPDDVRAETMEKIRGMVPGKPVFCAFHSPFISRGLSERTDSLNGLKVYGFSGLADNNSFRQTLKQLGCELAGFSDFPDHHRYSDGDLEKVSRQAEEAGADCIAATEKDHVKIRRMNSCPKDIAVIGIEISMGDDEERFRDYIEKRIKKLIKI